MNGERLELEGEVGMTLLYVSEENTVCAFSASLPFSQSIAVSGLDETAVITARLRADSTACRYRLKGIDWNTKGDINQNSAITLSDTVLLQKYLLNLEPLTSSQMEIADINSDGRVNVLDICLLKAHLT